MESPISFRFGATTVWRIQDLRFDLPADDLFPDWQSLNEAERESILCEQPEDAAPGKIGVVVNSWLLGTPGGSVLIDTGVGNHNRPDGPTDAFLKQLESVGHPADSIDTVLITHVHSDHIGWLTTEKDGGYVPTFSNACHYFPKQGYDYFVDGPGRDHPRHELVMKTMKPVVDLGRVRWVSEDGGEVMPGVRYIPSQGHSIDHQSICWSLEKSALLFAGDVLHCSFQARHPQMSPKFDLDAKQAERSRKIIMAFAAEHELPVFSPHIGGTSAGYITREKEAFLWNELIS